MVCHFSFCVAQADDYNERILIPRRNAKREEQELKASQFSGPVWKGAAHALGVRIIFRSAAFSPIGQFLCGSVCSVSFDPARPFKC